MGASHVVLNFESADEILWCDHSNETSSAVVSHSAIRYSYYQHFKKVNLEMMSNIFNFCYFWELKGYIPVHDQVTSTNAFAI